MHTLQAQHEKELRALKNELLDMKKQRVKMLTKMRSEASESCLHGQFFAVDIVYFMQTKGK